MPGSGKTAQHTRVLSYDDESSYDEDDALNDLGATRREIITTTDTGRSRFNARELERLERSQRGDDNRQVAMQEGWFSLPNDSGVVQADIAEGQTHRVGLERDRRANDYQDYTGTSGDVRNMTSRAEPASRSGGATSGPLRGATNSSTLVGQASSHPFQPTQRPQQAQSHTTRQSSASQARGAVPNDSYSSTPRGLDPALDPDRNGYMGRMAPGRGPVLPSENSGRRKKKKRADVRPDSRPAASAPGPSSSNRPPPQVLPMFASGALAVNPSPSELVDKSTIESYLANRWAGAPVTTPDATSSVVAREAETSHSVPPDIVDGSTDAVPSHSTESSDNESNLDDSGVTELEEVYRNFCITDPHKCDDVAQPQHETEINDTPSTTPEPTTPVTTTGPQEMINCSPTCLIDDEPDQAEVERLPTVGSDLTQLQIQAQIQPVGSAKNEQHSRALASEQDFDEWFRNTRAPTTSANHTPATNRSQYVSDGYRSRELMRSRFAS